ncbi:MAG: hypothetical protein AAF727_07475 [Pseudomonadota bacterium]
MYTAIRTLVAALFIGVPFHGAKAELSAQETVIIQEKKGLRLVTSDGAVVGTADGVSVRDGRVRFYLLAKAGSIFSVGGGGKDVVVRTYTTNLTLRGADVIIDATEQRVKNKANMSFTDDSAPIEINLFTRG